MSTSEPRPHGHFRSATFPFFRSNGVTYDHEVEMVRDRSGVGGPRKTRDQNDHELGTTIDRLIEARDGLRAHLAAIEVVIADHEQIMATAEELLDTVQMSDGAPKGGREAIPRQRNPARKRHRSPKASQDAGDGRLEQDRRLEQARERTLRRIERRRPDLAEQVRKGTLTLHLADRMARPTHHLDHAPELSVWPAPVAELQRQLAEVGDQLEVAGEDDLDGLARDERRLTAALETAKAQAMEQQNGAG